MNVNPFFSVIHAWFYRAFLTWRHGGHVGVLLTKEFWLFFLFGTPTWPLRLLPFASLGIVYPLNGYKNVLKIHCRFSPKAIEI